LLAVFATSLPPIAYPADIPTQVPSAARPLDLNDDEIDRRLAFIRERLEGSRSHASIWNMAWTAVNAGTLGWTIYRAESDSDTDDRGRAITEASKAFIGLMDLYIFRPMTARHGADELSFMPESTHAQKLAKLKKAEEILLRNANRASYRYGWQMHVGNVLFNFGGAGAIWATGGDTSQALTSAFAGIAGGELMAWTEPGQPRQDFREYQSLTGGSTFTNAPGAWRLVAIPGGIAVARDF
jgi:hypothetical protein